MPPSPDPSEDPTASAAPLPGAADLTLLLERAGQEQDPAAQAELMDAAYARLRAIAGRFARGAGPSETLRATALVHEAYLRIFGRGPTRFDDRDHFFAAVATVIRQIAVDRARRMGAAKRGGAWGRTSLDGLGASDRPAAGRPGADAPHGADDLIDLDAALDRLAADSPRQARVVELRYFAGLSTAEIARILDLSVRSVELDWRAARARLRELMQESDEP